MRNPCFVSPCNASDSSPFQRAHELFPLPLLPCPRSTWLCKYCLIPILWEETKPQSICLPAGSCCQFRQQLTQECSGEVCGAASSAIGSQKPPKKMLRACLLTLLKATRFRALLQAHGCFPTTTSHCSVQPWMMSPGSVSAPWRTRQGTRPLTDPGRGSGLPGAEWWQQFLALGNVSSLPQRSSLNLGETQPGKTGS